MFHKFSFKIDNINILDILKKPNFLYFRNSNFASQFFCIICNSVIHFQASIIIIDDEVSEEANTGDDAER